MGLEIYNIPAKAFAKKLITPFKHFNYASPLQDISVIKGIYNSALHQITVQYLYDSSFYLSWD